MEIDFYLRMLGVFVASGLIFALMMRQQKRKQAEADAKFEMTMKMIELRNRTYGDKDESEKKT
jgi:hypothetical protein